MDSPKFSVKGIVQKVKLFKKSILSYFELETGIRIYGDLVKPGIPLPNVGQEINITTEYFDGLIAVIGPNTFVSCSDTTSSGCTNEESIQYSTRSECYDIEQIIEIDSCLKRLEEVVPEQFWSSVIKKLQKSSNVKLSKFSFITVKDLIDHNDPRKSVEYEGMCTYRVQVNTNGYFTAYLYGFFDIDPVYGWYRLNYGTSHYPVKFVYSNLNINWLNRHVLIKEWTFFTELFEEADVLKISYLVLDVKQMYLLKDDVAKASETKRFYRFKEHADTGHSLTTTIKLIRKSGIIYGYNKSTECWLEITISKENNEQCVEPMQAYAILKSSHFDICHLLREGMIYNLYHDSQLLYESVSNYKELYGLEMGNRVYHITADVVFHEISPNESIEHSVYYGNQITKLLCSPSNNMVWIAFYVAQKSIKFEDPESKYLFKRHENIPYIGIPGNEKQMALTMKIDGSTIPLYSPDWLNHVCPLGVLENVLIVVKNVQICSNQYFKTTVFTSFVIIQLPPHFDAVKTVRLPSREPIISTSLTLYEILPAYCVVRCPLICLSIIDLELIPRCFKCKKPISAKENCTLCLEKTERDLAVKMILLVQDVAIYPIKTELTECLYKVLGFKHKREVNRFCNSVLKMNQVHLDAEDLMPNYDIKELYESILPKSGTKKPKTQKPKTRKPQTKKLKTKILKTKKPKNKILKTKKPKNKILKTKKPKNKIPKTKEPKTKEPETKEPETKQSENEKSKSMKFKQRLLFKLCVHKIIFTAVCEKQEYIQGDEIYIPWKMIDFKLICA